MMGIEAVLYGQEGRCIHKDHCDSRPYR
jgi:hypothetical protein